MSDTKMNPVAKQLWLDALRSGEYVQTTGKLHDPDEDRYCCLGVLCAVAMNAGVEVPIQVLPIATQFGRSTHFGQESNKDSLPREVREWAGLGLEDNPSVTAVVTQYYDDEPEEVEDYYDLATLNDDYDRSFTELADLIEECL